MDQPSGKKMWWADKASASEEVMHFLKQLRRELPSNIRFAYSSVRFTARIRDRTKVRDKVGQDCAALVRWSLTIHWGVGPGRLVSRQREHNLGRIRPDCDLDLSERQLRFCLIMAGKTGVLLTWGRTVRLLQGLARRLALGRRPRHFCLYADRNPARDRRGFAVFKANSCPRLPKCTIKRATIAS